MERDPHRNGATHDLLEAAPTMPFNLELLQAFCRTARFERGDVLRRTGLHYRDMHVIADGLVEIEVGPGLAPAGPPLLGPGSLIGEISFLRGCTATATVTTRTTVRTFVIDDPTLARFENEKPVAAAQFLRQIAESAEARTSTNLTFVSTSAPYARAPAVEVHLCRNREMLESAQRLRYEVYCDELGRKSPYADHERKIISDSLDEAGNTFVAIEGGETVGTLRVNLATEGRLGVLEELYGMRTSPFHPDATCICTKFIVKRARRGSPVSFKLISAVVRLGMRENVKECYIDCIPTLLPYYKAMRFRIAGQTFFHRENGPSVPMKLDVAKFGESLAADPTVGRFLSFYARAKVIKWADRLRRKMTSAIRAEDHGP